ncbi:MAG TPA: hypothetical protein VJ323_04755 [Bryobacteraceae bacterium]|jgi:hypothetical protein|nr:hypothetical protein [Bryobacteraceae bacterium]
MPLAKLVFLSVVTLFVVQIQVATAAELPLGMKTGIDRFAQMHSHFATKAPMVAVASLPQSMWAPGQRIDLSASALRTRFDLPAVCSIPLREMRIDHPERFASRPAKFPGTRDEMPRTQGPAPVCGAKFLASLR